MAFPSHLVGLKNDEIKGSFKLPGGKVAIARVKVSTTNKDEDEDKGDGDRDLC